MAMAERDIGMKQPKIRVVINGYPSLAAFIASDKDRSTSIYRSYHRLTSRNLLYLEAELFELERRLDDLDDEDLKGDISGTQFARSWTYLNSSDDPRCIERVKLIKEIRCLLKEYQEALILQQDVLKMGKPHKRTVEAFKAWMDGEADGRGVAVITDLSAQRLDDPDDLVALHLPMEQDWLIRFVRKYLHIFFLEGSVDGSLAYFSERRIARAVEIIGIVLAAILLIGAIVNLYIVQNNNVRLGLLGGYTAAFALCVGLLTSARRAELFASTAAYAAVLVVFVSGSLGSPGCINGS